MRYVPVRHYKSPSICAKELFFVYAGHNAILAQSVEQQTENLRVVGSIPMDSTL